MKRNSLSPTNRSKQFELGIAAKKKEIEDLKKFIRQNKNGPPQDSWAKLQEEIDKYEAVVRDLIAKIQPFSESKLKNPTDIAQYMGELERKTSMVESRAAELSTEVSELTRAAEKRRAELEKKKSEWTALMNSMRSDQKLLMHLRDKIGDVHGDCTQLVQHTRQSERDIRVDTIHKLKSEVEAYHTRYNEIIRVLNHDIAAVNAESKRERNRQIQMRVRQRRYDESVVLRNGAAMEVMKDRRIMKDVGDSMLRHINGNEWLERLKSDNAKKLDVMNEMANSVNSCTSRFSSIGNPVDIHRSVDVDEDKSQYELTPPAELVEYIALRKEVLGEMTPLERRVFLVPACELAELHLSAKREHEATIEKYMVMGERSRQALSDAEKQYEAVLKRVKLSGFAPLTD